jgi:hypothetical protein
MPCNATQRNAMLCRRIITPFMSIITISFHLINTSTALGHSSSPHRSFPLSTGLYTPPPVQLLLHLPWFTGANPRTPPGSTSAGCFVALRFSLRFSSPCVRGNVSLESSNHRVTATRGPHSWTRRDSAYGAWAWREESREGKEQIKCRVALLCFRYTLV